MVIVTLRGQCWGPILKEANARRLVSRGITDIHVILDDIISVRVVSSCRDDDAEGRMKYARGTKYESKEWFYGKITRQEAESWLSRLADQGDYLVRQSETNVSPASIIEAPPPSSKHQNSILQLYCSSVGMFADSYTCIAR